MLRAHSHPRTIPMCVILSVFASIHGQAQSTMPLTIDGIKQYVDANRIANVKQLLSNLPSQLKKNYVLMETSRGDRPATALSPRVIMYSADARLLISVGSHGSDALREVADLAELNPATGFWNFRSLDFRQNPAVLSADDQKCQRCHGSPAKPLWSNYGNWPGAFGPDFDRLTQSQADALNWFLPNQAQTDRLHHLIFDRPGSPYRAGTFFFIDRDYGYANTVFGFELSTAIAEGLYRRMRNNPRYPALRNGFLLLRNGCDTSPERLQSDAWRQFEAAMRSAGANGMSERELYRVLGVDFDHDLSIANLQTDVRKDAFWSNGEDFLFGLIGMLVLDEAAAQSPRLRTLLASTREDPAFSVNEPDLGKALAYRINAGWRLRGEERQAQRERALRLNTFRGDQGIFDPLGKNLCTAIFGSSVTPNPTGGTVKTWTGTIPRQGGFAYLPRFEDPIQSGAGTIEATLTGPSGASFQFLLISLDRYSVVATASGSGPVKTLRYAATPGRYVWYVQAQTGSGAFLIEARIP